MNRALRHQALVHCFYRRSSVALGLLIGRSSQRHTPRRKKSCMTFHRLDRIARRNSGAATVVNLGIVGVGLIHIALLLAI